MKSGFAGDALMRNLGKRNQHEPFALTIISTDKPRMRYSLANPAAKQIQQ